MNILALDQARAGGWSVFDYESQELVAYGTFEFDSNKYTYAQAIMHIKEIVASIIDAYDIQSVWIEDIQYRCNIVSYKKLAQLQGVLVNFFEESELLYGYVAPSQWQNFCRARSRSSKEIKSGVSSVDPGAKKESKMLSIQFVKDTYGVDTKNDNLADAISIGHYVVQMVIIDHEKHIAKKRDKKGAKRDG